MSTRDTLFRAGILPYGSVELERFETRLTRYFTREYRRQMEAQSADQSTPIPTGEGPMWAQTEQLMEEHFDAHIKLFRGFLDPKYMAYTTAWYGHTPEEIRASSSTLVEAEKAKFDLIAERARLRGDERIFNLGCGFGPLETYLFERHPDLSVTSITPSQVQCGYIRNCMQQPEHPLYGRDLRLIEGDFSAVPLEELGEQRYDLLFAVGAFEHVNNLTLAFDRIDRLLRPGGRCFLHLIVSQPSFPQYHDSQKTLIGKFFPGGHIWPQELMTRQGGNLRCEQSWYLNGLNYWRTLDEWHRNFWEHIDQLHPDVLSEQEVRHWNDYFIQCKVGLFAPDEGRIYGNGHFLYRKPA